MQNTLAKFNISWEFITARSPWHGAWWERMVTTVKRPLRKVLGRNILPFRDFATLLTDVEAVVNSRPTSAISSDPSEVRALTPADLLLGYTAKTMLPDTDSIAVTSAKATPLIMCNRWLHQQKVLTAFWKRFNTEYLQFLRSAHLREPVARRPLREGNVCLLKTENPSRA